MKIPIVFCFDRRILTGAGVSILSLTDAAADSTSYEIHILHPDLPPAAMSALAALVDGTRHSVQFHKILPERFSGAPSNKGSWTEVVYFRLLTSEVLTNRDRAIYSDVDVFFRKDLQQVFLTDMNDHEWCGVIGEKNVPDYVLHKHFPANKNEYIYSSAFMLMDLAAMRENGAVQRYFDALKVYKDDLKFFDLDLVNIATPGIGALPFDYSVLEDLYETEDITTTKDYRFLKTAYSVEDLLSARNDPSIIHFAGPRGKPWQRRDVPAYYMDVVRRLPPELRKETFRDFRKRVLGRRGRAHLVTRTPSRRLGLFEKI